MNEPRPRRKGDLPAPSREIVSLEDLAPREPVKGGGRKRLFGEEPARKPGKKPTRD